MILTHLTEFAFFPGASDAIVGGVLSTGPPHLFLLHGADEAGVAPIVALDVDWLYRHDRHYPAVPITVATPFAAFSWDATTDPPIVYFTSESVGATMWLWDFGDSQSSSERDPTHLFSFVGDLATFAVTLTINGNPNLNVTHLVEVSKLLGGPISLTLNTLTMEELNTLTMEELNTLTVI